MSDLVVVQVVRFIEPGFCGVGKHFDFEMVVILLGGDLEVIEIAEDILRLPYLVVEGVLTQLNLYLLWVVHGILRERLSEGEEHPLDWVVRDLHWPQLGWSVSHRDLYLGLKSFEFPGNWPMDVKLLLGFHDKQYCFFLIRYRNDFSIIK